MIQAAPCCRSLRSIVAMAGALAALGLAACSLGPHYKRPDIPAPTAWQQPAAQQAQTVESAPAWPSADWWKGFHSSQLDELMTEARSANDDIAAAIARVREADAQARIAGAALLPSLEATGDGTRERTKSGPTISTTSVSNPTGAGTSTVSTFNLFSAELGASYEIDFWGHNRALHDAARLAAVGSRYDRATVELTVMTSVATTYFEVLEARDRLKVAEDNLTRAQTVLDGLNLQHTAGIVTALDVAQQETTVATLQAAVPPLREQLVQSLDALAILVGKEPQSLQIAPGTLVELSEPTVAPGLPSELLARRPDVASAEAQLASANANVAAARAAFFPTIALTADGGYASTALAGLLNPANRIFTLSAGITQPIFQGGALVGQYSLNKARYSELLADYHKAVISAFGNVQDALAALQQTADQQQRQQDAVDKALRAYDLSQTQMHAGTVNILTVLNTESALFTAQDALVQVKFAHLQALIALFNALGGGWQQT